MPATLLLLLYFSLFNKKKLVHTGQFLQQKMFSPLYRRFIASIFLKRLYQSTVPQSVTPSNSASTIKNHRESRNDPALKLIAGLNQQNDTNKSSGSPFILPDIKADDYLRLFWEQVSIEEQSFTKIRNVTRRSQYEPMEKVIEGWEWRELIEENLEKIIEESNMSQELMAYISQIDVKEFAEQIISLLQAILCRGQTSVPIAELEAVLPKIITQLNKDKTLKLLNQMDKKELEKTFIEYAKYYTDENIAKNYTVRDWWYKCARKFNFSPNSIALLASFQIPLRDVSHMLISFIIDNCEFPLPVRNSNQMERKSRKWVKAFSVEDIPLHKMNPHVDVGRKLDMCKMLRINREISGHYCLRHQFEYLYFPSDLLPMKAPPKPWLDKGTVGPNYTFKQNLVRRLDEYPDMDINEEILVKRIKTREQARPVFDALNCLGATPWKINEEMLGNLQIALKLSYKQSKADFLRKLSIPRHPKTIWIPIPTPQNERLSEKDKKNQQKTNDPLLEAENNKEYQDKFEKHRQKLMKLRNEQNSLWCWLAYRLILAKYYTGQIIYFPHNIDFRGRTYPISPQINHMGDDINRGILKFAKGKPLGEDGFRWLKLHCINITGKLKRSPLSDRLDYAERHINEMVDAANRPFNGGDWWWKESEEPWQTLAACIEIRDAIGRGNPHTFCSHLPIHQDGSCNGLQHYAALGRDLKGAREVNLLPELKPQDIYSTVVESVERMRLADEQDESSKFNEVAKELRTFLPGPLERKIIKQTVMTTVYGVTKYGASEQIKRQLLDKDVPKKEASKFGIYLARRTFDGLTDAFQNSMQLMDWFKSCAGHVLKLKRPMEWITPLGLPVIQPYVTIERVEDGLCFLPVSHKQKNAFPPNFVHSLDSTHMMLTALYCAKRGITFAAVHDCFWTHASDVDEMNRICREQFIALHKEPIIQDLSEHFFSTYLTEDTRELMPKKLMERVEQAFRPSMELGELDINEVRNSIYFFS